MLQTPTSRQNAIITFYNKALMATGINVIRKTGPGLQLRAKMSGDFAAVLKAILPCTLDNVGKIGEPISGTYDAYILTITKQIPGTQKGDQCYFVQATKNTAVTSQKELAPSTLRLAGKTIAKQAFKRTVLDAVKNSKADDSVKGFLQELMDASATRTGVIRGTMIDALSKQDLNMISNDFGEISGAYWYLMVHNPKVASIEYPAASNQKLVDYFANIGTTQKVAISAKAGGGSAPSIKSIADVLKNNKYNDSKKEKARNAIIAISDDTAIEGIIQASKLLQVPAYTYLKTNFLKHDYNSVDLERYLMKFRLPMQISNTFGEYYKIIGRQPAEKTIDEIFNTRIKRNGLLISPMAYSLVDELNKNTTYVSVLNDAAKSIKLTQIYMKINANSRKVAYDIHEFNQANFRFEYHSNAKKPGNNRIGFELIK